MNSWDVATRYHEFKTTLKDSTQTDALRRLSAQAIIDRARNLLGSVAHPSLHLTSPLTEVPAEAEQTDLDLEETLEHSSLQLARSLPMTSADLWMSYQVPRVQPLIIAVDTSLSMTGEKLALTAVALAVVLLQFPTDPVGIVGFETSATVLKEPEERLTIQTLVERFLDLPCQGYTHLEDGMLKALELIRSLSTRGRRPSTVLISDGKYTAGRDPAYLAHRFPHLVVVKMGKEKSSLGLCLEMARKGNGHLQQVDRLESLPEVMSDVVRSLVRGQSLVS